MKGQWILKEVYFEDGWPSVMRDPIKKWNGLTDEELESMAEQYVTDCYFDTLKYGQAIQSKLKERNNG